MNVGLIGCGNISGAYLKNAPTFSQMKITACADLRPEAAQACVEKFGLKAMGVDELLSDPAIDTVLNLTPPAAHSEINMRALEAGKTSTAKNLSGSTAKTLATL